MLSISPLPLCYTQIVLVSYSYKRNPILHVRKQVRQLFCPPHTCETIADMKIVVLAHYRHIIRIRTRTMFTSNYLRRRDMQISAQLENVFSYQRKLMSTSYSSYWLVLNIKINTEFIFKSLIKLYGLLIDSFCNTFSLSVSLCKYIRDCQN